MKRLYRSPSLKKRLRKKREFEINKIFGILLVYILIFSSLSYAQASEPVKAGSDGRIFNDNTEYHFYRTVYDSSTKITKIEGIDGTEIGILPEGYGVIGRNKGLVFVRTGETKQELEIGSFKIRLDENSELIVQEGNTKLIELKGTGDIRLGDSLFKDIKNAKFEAGKEEKYGYDQIIYAEFISNKKNVYTIRHNGENYNFETEPGSYVKFDAKNNKIEGKDVVFDYKNNVARGEFEVNFDNNKISSINIKNGAYMDLDNNLRYSSDEDFKVVFNQDIHNEKNAVSIIKSDGKNIIQAKGKIKIENGLKYEGLNENVFTTYDSDNKDFTVLNGDAAIENDKHKINLRNGRIFLDNKELDSGVGESFTFSYSLDGEKFYFGKVDEKNGNLKLALSNPNHIFLTSIVPFGEYGVDIQKIFKRRSSEVESKTIEAMKSTLEELNLQIESLGENADQELIKSRDLLELRLIQIETKEDYDKTISTLNGYLEKNRNGEAASLAQMQLAEIYQERAFTSLKNIAYEENILNNKEKLNGLLVFEFPKSKGLGGIEHQETIYFKTVRDEKGEEIITAWSKDGRNFNSVNKKVRGPPSYGETVNPQEVILYLPQDALNILNNLENKQVITDLEGDMRDVNARMTDYSRHAASKEVKETFNIALTDYEKAIKFYEEARKNKDIETEAGFGLASTYLQLNRINDAENVYLEIKNKAESNLAKSYSAMGIATVNMKNGLAGPALASAYEALDYDPTNDAALALRRQLESSYLEIISRSINSEHEELSKLYEDNTGVNSNILQLIVGGKIARYASGEYEAKTQQYNSLIKELGNQERGLILVKSLYNSGLELSEIKKLTDLTEEDESALVRIAEIYKLPIDSEDKNVRDKSIKLAKELQSSMYYAFQNPDLKSLYEGKGKQGFNFETGEGYADKEFVKQTGKDIVVDLVNGMVLTMVPAKAVVSLGKSGVKGLAALEGTSVLARAGRGIGTGLISIGEKGSKIKATISELKVLQELEKTSPKLAGVVRYAGAEAAESIAGSITERLVPGSGAYTELLTGYSNAFDVGGDIIKKGVKKGRVLLTDNNELIYGLGFSDGKQMNQFTWIAEKSPEYKNKIRKLGENLFEINGKKFFVYDETKGVPEFIGRNKVLENRDIKEILKSGRANVNEVSERLTLYERETRGRISEIEEDFITGEINIQSIRNKQLELDARVKELNGLSYELEKTEGVKKFIDKERLGEKLEEGEIEQFVKYKDILEELQQVKNEKRAVDGFLKNIPEVKPKEEINRPEGSEVEETERIFEEAGKTEAIPTSELPEASREAKIISEAETVSISDAEANAKREFDETRELIESSKGFKESGIEEKSSLANKLREEAKEVSDREIRKFVDASVGKAIRVSGTDPRTIPGDQEFVYTVVKELQGKFSDFGYLQAAREIKVDMKMRFLEYGFNDRETDEIIYNLLSSKKVPLPGYTREPKEFGPSLYRLKESPVRKALLPNSLWDNSGSDIKEILEETEIKAEIPKPETEGELFGFRAGPELGASQRLILNSGAIKEYSEEINFHIQRIEDIVEPKMDEVIEKMTVLSKDNPEVSEYQSLISKNKLDDNDKKRIVELEGEKNVKVYKIYGKSLKEYNQLIKDAVDERLDEVGLGDIKNKFYELGSVEEEVRTSTTSEGYDKAVRKWKSLVKELGLADDANIFVAYNGDIVVTVRHLGLLTPEASTERIFVESLEKFDVPELDTFVKIASAREGVPPIVSVREIREIRGVNDAFKRTGDLDSKTEGEIISIYEKDPLKASILFDPEILNKLNLGKSGLDATLVKVSSDVDEKAKLIGEATRSGIKIDSDQSGKLVLPKTQKFEYVQGRYGAVLEEQNGIRTTLTTDSKGNPVIVTHSVNNIFVTNAPESLEGMINKINNPDDLEEKLSSWILYNGYEGKKLNYGISDEEVKLLYERCPSCFEPHPTIKGRLIAKNELPFHVEIDNSGKTSGTGSGYRHLLKHNNEFKGKILDEVIDKLDKGNSFDIPSHTGNVLTIVRSGDKEFGVFARDNNGNIITLFSAVETGDASVRNSVLLNIQEMAKSSDKITGKPLSRIFRSKDGKEVYVVFDKTGTTIKYEAGNRFIVSGLKQVDIKSLEGSFTELRTRSQKERIFERIKKGYLPNEIDLDLSGLVGR